ncbi:hypothetical protein MAFF211479_38790 (plasmid) [Ralstonia solanacearum]|nr:hypothetical protein MAFF211479_38790 [Ralstonia solanacearum]BCL99328.1 hypothetical protein MAFF211491_37800 [Ralstonia solanacearum]BCM14805.1 hypothetical protein MAFF241648_39950 [Ralstonia solanacearum]BCN06744.1 hypothetical protein RPSB_38810 [Ralstonia solanacearum]BCN12905.1 hypothetical protein RPSD_47900 [Ralstonia solanacearum]
MLQTGIPWEDLPQELGFGSGMTCWRRLRDWQAAGVWDKLHVAMLGRLREHDQIDWRRASIDGASVSSPRGGQETGPNPTDRGKLGSKRHLVVDAQGIPLAVTVTSANRHDSIAFESTLDAIPAVRGLDGRPRKGPDKLHADKGYDCRRCRRYLKRRGITARIARIGVESKHDWAGIDGLLSARMLGLPASASCASASNDDSIFTPRSFLSPLQSSVLDS